MGYNGLGLQRWIYTMKPRKYLGGRSKPDGGGGHPATERDINDYYHLKPNSLENVGNRKYSVGYKKKITNDMEQEKQKRNVFSIVSLVIAAFVVALIFFYINVTFDWF